MRHKKDEKQNTMKGGFFSKLQSISLGFFLSFSGSVCSFRGRLLSTGANVAPHTTPFRTIPDMIHIESIQPYQLMSSTDRGANRKVPTPEPQEAMPVARARRLSK